MGLCAYGQVKKEWIPWFMDYYKANAASGEYEEEINKIIGKKIGVNFDRDNRLKGQIAYDIAATSQKAFEECFLEIAKPYIKKYPNIPIIVTGGCALNIILNTRIKKEFKREVFVGPNPNDCGLAVGLLLHHSKPKKPVDLTYSGPYLLDFNNLGNYIQNYPNGINLKIENPQHTANDLALGKIIGVARGKSEHGPRALGNRSILCNPSIKEM